MEYREWHEGDDGSLVFHSQRRIYFSDACVNKTMSLHELCRMTADVAVEDYRSRGMSREFLEEHGLAILVSRNSFRIHRWPVENEAVEFVTWEEKPQALQLVRCYKILGDEGALLVSGRSTWLVMDLNGRRILPAKKFTLRKTPEIHLELDCPAPSKISAEGSFELWDSRRIKFSDLDANGHTTNSRYAAFVEDALPAEFRGRIVKDFRINYSKEAMLDDELSVCGRLDAEASKVTVAGRTKDFVSFEAELFF